jgi:hypothetical protein
MGYASRQGRARVSASRPQAAGTCDRCSFVYQHHTLRWQMDYAGAGLINKRLLVCDRCYDEPNQQLRAIVIAPDPVPIVNARPEQYGASRTNNRVTSGYDTIDPVTGIPVPGGDTRITQDDDTRVTQQTGAAAGSLNEEPGTDPNVDGPTNVPPGNTSIPNTGPL